MPTTRPSSGENKTAQTTTMLWVLPEAFRGLTLGLFMLLFKRKQLTADRLLHSKAIIGFIAACILTGVLASCLNTFALYVDSKMYGYYNEYMVFGVLAVRLTMAAVMSGLFGYVTLHITSAMGRSKII